MLRRPLLSLLALALALRLAHGGLLAGAPAPASVGASANVPVEIRALLAEPLTAGSAVRLSFLAEPSLRARLLETGVDEGRLEEARRLPNPTIEVEFWGPSGKGDDEARTEASIEWDVTTALLTGRRTAAASAALGAARLRAEAATVARAFEVESAFHSVRGAKRKLAIARTRAELAAVVADTARALVDAGNAAALSALREDASRERAALALSEAELVAVDAEERLSILLGAGSVEGVREAVAAIGDEAPPLPAALPATSTLEDAALASNLELRELDARLRAVAARIRLAKAEGRWPDVSLRVRTEREEGSWRIGGGVSIRLPLVDRGQGRLASLLAERRSLEERRRATEAAVGSAARRAASRLSLAHARAARYGASILPRQERITAETLLHANAMQVGIPALLAARDAELAAASAAADADRDYAVALAATVALRSGLRVDAPASPSLSGNEPASPEGGH
ncbi:MAG: TolC family protein [Holophagales bacterium]|nr:TolC family protein [Holophagales bacterium]